MSDQSADAFRVYLRDHNLPITAQRLAIAEVVLGSDRHLSVDEVARELSERGAAAGTATVYRTLELLVRSGLVVERDFGEGFKRYEPTRDQVAADIAQWIEWARTRPADGVNTKLPTSAVTSPGHASVVTTIRMLSASAP